MKPQQAMESTCKSQINDLDHGVLQNNMPEHPHSPVTNNNLFLLPPWPWYLFQLLVFFSLWHLFIAEDALKKALESSLWAAEPLRLVFSAGHLLTISKAWRVVEADVFNLEGGQKAERSVT